MIVNLLDDNAYFDRAERSGFENNVKTILRELKLSDTTELCVTFIDDKYMRKLNKQYRGLNKTTDVLSFPQSGPDPDVLGDIAISVDTAGRNARRYGVTLTEEILTLIVHGTLHLLGYDHEKKSKRELMRGKEKELMSTLEPKSAR
ncbi:MAG: rRNA maturation RNase YbeY [Candidatus Dadabacteria bacterium]|nr:rRNA maturation RNase YbeY [Candidatus Dadabacteria bacterium]